jgi:hypothetical protein
MIATKDDLVFLEQLGLPFVSNRTATFLRGDDSIRAFIEGLTDPNLVVPFVNEEPVKYPAEFLVDGNGYLLCPYGIMVSPEGWVASQDGTILSKQR